MEDAEKISQAWSGGRRGEGGDEGDGGWGGVEEGEAGWGGVEEGEGWGGERRREKVGGGAEGGERGVWALGRMVREWYTIGESARVFGGCCRTRPAHITAIRRALASAAVVCENEQKVEEELALPPRDV